MSSPLLEVRALSKTFPGLRALDDVSLSVEAGQVLAVVGQNGSGKSTLVKILAGVHAADDGAEIRVRGGDGQILTGTDAQRELHFIHQDLGLISSLTTVENLDLGRGLGRRDWLPFPIRRERARAQELISEFGGSFDVNVPVRALSAAERTIIAIARALDGWMRPDHVLILDEPTAALHGEEVHKLFEAVRRVASRGAGVIFISHRLDEVLSLADRVIALRDGRIVADALRGRFDHDELVRMIAGRDIEATQRESAKRDEEIVMRIAGISGRQVRDLGLDIHAGEILGVAGILGSGREEIAAMVFGARSRAGGEVRVGDHVVPASDPRSAIRHGLAFVPADRHAEGAIIPMTGRENLTLPELRTLRTRAGSLNLRAERHEAARWASQVSLQPPDPERPLDQFSGGNQQKIVLAKWLRNEPRVLLLDEPTQGVDVGAKAAIYALIADAVGTGAAVLLASSETKELVSLCDRVIVLRDGGIVAELAGTGITEARIIRESLGLSGDDADDLVAATAEDLDV